MNNIEVTHSEDQCWLRFKPSQGPEASVSLTCIAETLPAMSVIKRALHNWIEEDRNRQAASKAKTAHCLTCLDTRRVRYNKYTKVMLPYLPLYLRGLLITPESDVDMVCPKCSEEGSKNE